jgi:[protein-PII] uridylyltransferase
MILLADTLFERIIAQHRRGAGGTATARALTRRLDRAIIDCYKSLATSFETPVALAALGGYGREELCFASDTDIMVLTEIDSTNTSTGEAVRHFLHRLHDLGLQLGHSVRTVQECIAMADTDLEVRTSLLESRFLCGNRRLYADYLRSMRDFNRRSGGEVFLNELVHAMELRHARYGTSSKLLEPNVKNSAGGLRDLHAVLWLMRGTGKAALRPASGSRGGALQSLLRSPFMRRHVDLRLLRENRRALDFLLRVRNEMHLQAQGLHDTLEFLSQSRVAEGLGYRRRGQQTNVERFMQDYYVAARAVDRLTQRVFGSALERTRPRPRSPQVVIDTMFVMHDDALRTRLKAPKLTSLDVLRAAILCSRHRIVFAPSLADLVSRQASRLTPLRTREEASLFRTVLNEASGVSDTLQTLNNVGALERLIPEWRPMVAFFQHNIYHYYTADEHTLKVVESAEKLVQADSSFGEVFRSLQSRETLYFACLFHDIAKPKRIGNHEIIGADMAARILTRLHAADIRDDVRFLIRNHLLMEQTAFRRNLNDPQTIGDFAAAIPHVRLLDYLYVLTYADLNAVNKNVWTDWKGMLLHELYRKTRDVLDRGLTKEEVHGAMKREYDTARRSLLEALSGEASRAAAVEHFDAIDSPAYLSVFSKEEIAEHIRQIDARKPVSVVFSHAADVSEVTMIAPDAPYALSNFCGVLSANDANILDAHIFTRTDGIIIDKFRVVDAISKSALNGERCRAIESEVVDVLQSRTDIEHLLQRHRMKWKRRRSHRNPNTRIDVEFEDHPRFTIVDVFAPDMLGFLYRVTSAISNLGLDISFAKIATRADGIVDSFYVTGRTGSKVDDPAQREQIRSEILRTIHDLMEHQLLASE